jgi:hypothetical protein
MRLDVRSAQAGYLVGRMSMQHELENVRREMRQEAQHIREIMSAEVARVEAEIIAAWSKKCDALAAELLAARAEIAGLRHDRVLLAELERERIINIAWYGTARDPDAPLQ